MPVPIDGVKLLVSLLPLIQAIALVPGLRQLALQAPLVVLLVLLLPLLCLNLLLLSMRMVPLIPIPVRLAINSRMQIALMLVL